MIRILCLSALLLVSGNSAAHAGSFGTELPFASGTGARASALGLAGTSLSGSPSLQYFNPAAMARCDYKAFEFYRTVFFDSDAQYNTISYVNPSLDYGTIGVSVLRLDVAGVEERDNSNNLLGDIQTSQSRVLLGYALDVHPALSVGANLKIDNQSFGGVSGTGVGLDIAFHGRRKISDVAIFRELQAGLTVENMVEPSVKLLQDKVADPMKLALGASLRCVSGSFGFTTALDLVSPRYSPFQFRIGQQVDYSGYFALRAGFDGDRATFGVGGSYRQIALDYAWRDAELGGNHRVSLSMAFGASVSERETARREMFDNELRERVSRSVSEFEGAQLGRLNASADSLFNAGDFARARDQYEMVLVWDAGNARAAKRVDESRFRAELKSGHTFMADGNYVTAIYHFRLAEQMRPGDDALTDLIATCQKRIDVVADRARVLDRMLKAAIDVYAESRYVEAQAGFDEILRLDPGHRLASEYQLKCRTNIDNSVQRMVVDARALAARGDLARAISMLNDALARAPGNEQIALEKRALEEKRRQQTAATAPATPQSRRRPTAPAPNVDRRVLDAKYEEGIILFEKGDFQSSSRLLMEVWSVAPLYRNVSEPLTRAYLFLGMKMYSEGQYDDAIRIWEKILIIDPGNDKARRYLQKTREEANRLGGVTR